MNIRRAIEALLVLSVCQLAVAQRSVRATKIPGPIRDAGVYHAASGLWTRPAQSPVISASKIFSADTPSGYFGAGFETSQIADEGIIPGTGNPEFGAPGTADEYLVDGFEFAYCTEEPASIDWEVFLYDGYVACDDPDVPANCMSIAGSIEIEGAPGGAVNACWTVTVDLSGGSEICMLPDGGTCNPGWDLASSGLDHFGWGLQLDWMTYTGVATGPVLAGYEPAWAGLGTCYDPGPGCGGLGLNSGAGAEDHFGVGVPWHGCFNFGGYQNLNGCVGPAKVPPGQMLFNLYAKCERGCVVDDFRDQPPFEFSTISAHDSQLGPNDDIWDNELADWLSVNLEPGGTPIYQDLKFVFQQCFGGGMLDDLHVKLNGDWVGSSACRFDECSRGSKLPGLNDYTRAWAASNKLNMRERHEEAEADDFAAANGVEDPQITGEGNWFDIQLGGAQSRHAILFCGQPSKATWEHLMRVREALITDGNFPAGNIEFFSGDGTKHESADAADPEPDGPGTKAAFKQAIEDVAPKMNANEQLFIYVTDHGDNHKVISPPDEEEEQILPGGTWEIGFSLPEYILEGMALADAPGPDLSLETRDVVNAANEVILNGQSLGFLSVTGAGNTGTDSFSISPNQVGFNNSLEVKSGQGQDLFVSNVTAGTGPVPIQSTCESTTFCGPADGHPGNVAEISASGCILTSITTVDASNVPPGQNGYLIVGDGQGMASPNQGTLCVIGPTCIGRYTSDVQNSGAAGTFSTDVSNSASGGPNYGLPAACTGNIQAGETWYFQYWHRLPGGQDTFSQAIGLLFI